MIVAPESGPRPRLTIGLPVYNGALYLEEALDSLLCQTFQDFELIISDNASTDETARICARYCEGDTRIRYVRQTRNIGCAANHRFVFEQCRCDLFKWAASDDIYAPDLIERCVAALDAHPDAVLAHSWTALVTEDPSVQPRQLEYGLATESGDKAERFRSLLFDDGGDDDYGVMRADVLRRTPLHDSYHRADRTLVAELALLGRFVHVHDWLYFRRDHPASSRRASLRDRCVNFDPRRANRLRHPMVRLVAEYIVGYVRAINRVPMPADDRRRCYAYLTSWIADRTVRVLSRRALVANRSLRKIVDPLGRARSLSRSGG
jgi:glycosyltransferase involved in cell wall biosynthesis